MMVNKAFLKAYNVPKRDMVLGMNALTEPANVRQGVVKYIREALSGKIVQTPEIEFISPYENKRTFTKSRLFPIFDTNNKLTNVVVIHEDITERKKTEEELRRTLEKFERINEKLFVLSGLTRHDIQNKLQVASNCVFLVKQKVQADSEALELVERIQSVCGHVKKILDVTRAFEKLGVEELILVNLGEIIDRVVSQFLDLHDVKVVNDCRGLIVLADSLLAQIFSNLMDNSVKHGERVNKISIKCNTGKDCLKLVYEDNGVGISNAEKEKIFREGYGKDTGYGLWLVKKMCEVYGWCIRETGKQNKGAQFTLTIPKTNKSGQIGYRLH